MDYWWWLSFADESGNLGACIVLAADRDAALTRSWDKGWNPGGEVAIVGPIEMRNVPESYKVERRFTPEQLADDPDMLRWPERDS